MVHYNQDRSPGLTQWSGTSLHASLVLDQPSNVALTNLDIISGKCTVRCGKSTDIATIVVKLEGETRTRLMSPQGPQGEKPKPQIEYHKILYQLQTVFPPSEVAKSRNEVTGKGAYTLPPGQHEYPFKFKIPFNNQCWGDKSPMPVMLGLEMARPAPFHVKQTLPPTVSGFPGECEIRYFVKVTVNRHSIFKENPRAFAPFNFFPIEPPRPPPSRSEIFARQRHQFATTADIAMKPKMKALFNKKSSAALNNGGDALYLSVDARLPEPAILTCNRDIPLRLILTKLNASSDMTYLRSLQISLIGNTKLRAHDVFRTETQSWIIMMNPSMNVLIGSASDPVGTENVLDSRLWQGQLLPNTVAPSFETCNISRTYQLDIRVGLGTTRSTDASKPPQSVVLPLRLDTLVYSGIAPPPEVLQRMAGAHSATNNAASTPITSTNLPRLGKLSLSTNAAVSSSSAAHPTSSSLSPASAATQNAQFPITPIDPSAAEDHQFPVQMGSAADAEPPSYSDAPPSYEDAVATDLPPVSAPRPSYHPPPGTAP